MEVSRSFNEPSRIFRRDSYSASATATDSNGCVVCGRTPDCPTCDDGEECLQSTQTCNSCPKVYCRALSGSSTSSGTSAKTIGGLAGGIVGGLLLLLVVGSYLFYKYYFKKKLVFNRVKHKEFYFDDDIEINFRHNQPDGGSSGTQLNQPSSRNSMATTIMTRASNIIPIAYIPGVTIGPNTNSGNSNSRASQYSETNTIDSDLIGDRFSKASIIGNPSLTTTAIRAKPKLVNIHEVGGANKNNDGGNRDAVPSTAVSASQLGGVRSIKVGDKKRYNPGLQSEVLEEEESDVDSVVPKEDFKSNDYEPFIIEDEDEEDSGDTTAENAMSDVKSVRSNRSNDSEGSILLDVEIDRNPLSPFDDTFTVNKSDSD